MKKIFVLSFLMIIFSLVSFSQKAFSAKITSKSQKDFFVKQPSGNYFVTFEVGKLSPNQLTTLENALKSSRGVISVTTSEIDNKTYFFKVEFYKFADNIRYYADFFKRNHIQKLIIDSKVVYPEDLIPQTK